MSYQDSGSSAPSGETVNHAGHQSDLHLHSAEHNKMSMLTACTPPGEVEITYGTWVCFEGNFAGADAEYGEWRSSN